MAPTMDLGRFAAATAAGSLLPLSREEQEEEVTDLLWSQLNPRPFPTVSVNLHQVLRELLNMEATDETWYASLPPAPAAPDIVVHNAESVKLVIEVKLDAYVNRSCCCENNDLTTEWPAPCSHGNRGRTVGVLCQLCDYSRAKDVTTWGMQQELSLSGAQYVILAPARYNKEYCAAKSGQSWPWSRLDWEVLARSYRGIVEPRERPLYPQEVALLSVLEWKSLGAQYVSTDDATRLAETFPIGSAQDERGALGRLGEDPSLVHLYRCLCLAFQAASAEGEDLPAHRIEAGTRGGLVTRRGVC